MNWKTNLLFTLLLTSATCLHGQVADTFYTADYLDRSTRFAWTTFGGDVLALTGGKADYLLSEALKKADFGNTYIPRLSIGGIHFWGHADFYVTFPLGFLAVADEPAAFEKMKYQHGIETGAKGVPWAIGLAKFAALCGHQFPHRDLKYERPEDDFPEGYPVRQRFVTPAQAGLTYAGKKYLFTATAHYLFDPEVDYYLGENRGRGQVDFNPLSVSLGVSRYFDADAGARQPKGIEQENLRHGLLKKYGKLSGFYWGLGPSAALQMSKSSFFEKQHPQFYDQLTGGLMPDLTFGYHFYKPDLNVGLSYRTMGDRLQAIEDDIRLRRHSVIEAYKFLFNYLGFVPYAGVMLKANAENLSADVNGTDYSDRKIAPGIVFGWDIRVVRNGTSLLRTNLRWTPNLHLGVEGEKILFDHLEFNFIQYVHYIGRGKFYEQFRKRD